MKKEIKIFNTFKLKRKISNYIVLELLNNNLEFFEKQFNKKLINIPNFFKNLPCIVDLKNLESNKFIDFYQLQSIIKKKNLVLMGVYGANKYHKINAIQSNLSIINRFLKQKKSKKIIYKTKIINRQIRSGEQIYEKEANIIILKPVSSGAEILSDGNIHIYSTLKGKALAGINGNKKARIFCNKIEAELVAVAGTFKVMGEIKKKIWSRSAMVFLENNLIKIKTF